jgi:TonB family protein
MLTSNRDRPTMIRIALSLLLLASAGACASRGAAEGSAPTPATAETGAEMRNRSEALRLMDRYYPQLLRDARVTGEVVVRITLDAQGGVVDRRVVRSTQEQFSNAALTVAEQLLFTRPAAAGEALEVEMHFRPDNTMRIDVRR